MKEVTKMKKIFLTVLSFIIVVVIAAFICYYGKLGKNYQDTLFLDVYASKANYQGLQKGWYSKIIKDKFNIELNIIAPNVSQEGNIMYKSRLSYGNLGDIVIITNQQLKECVDNGILADITSYLKNEKYLKKHQAAIENLRQYVGQEGVYGIPTGTSSESASKPMLYGNRPIIGSYMPWDFYMELGYPEIQDDTDLLQVLLSMKNNHPITKDGDETYAFSFFKDWDGAYMTLAAIMASCYGYYPCTESIFTNADSTETQMLIGDNSVYYKVLKLFFKANQMGLVDPESGVQSFEEMFNKVKYKQIFYLWWAWMLGNYTSHGMDGYAFIPVANQTILNDGFQIFGDGYAIGIGKNQSDSHIARIMDFLDWSASPEGMMYYAAGIEGMSYEIVHNKPIITDFGLNAWNNNMTVPEKFGEGTYKEGFSQLNASIVNKGDTNPITGEPYDSALWSTTLNTYKSQLDKKWEEHYGVENVADYLINNNKLLVIPSCAYVPPAENITLNNKRTLCGNVVTENSWKMIFAENEQEFDTIWKNMKHLLYSYGYQDVIDADTKIVSSYRESKFKTLKLIRK